MNCVRMPPNHGRSTRSYEPPRAGCRARPVNPSWSRSGRFEPEPRDLYPERLTCTGRPPGLLTCGRSGLDRQDWTAKCSTTRTSPPTFVKRRLPPAPSWRHHRRRHSARRAGCARRRSSSIQGSASAKFYAAFPAGHATASELRAAVRPRQALEGGGRCGCHGDSGSR